MAHPIVWLPKHIWYSLWHQRILMMISSSATNRPTFFWAKKRHTISIKNIHRVIPCGCFLFTKLLCTFFQHFADWQMVRTSGFTFATFYTGGSLHRKRTVTVSCPVSQSVTVKISCEQEHTRNIDSHTTWSTIVTSAAEICAKLFSDFLNFFQFLLI